MYDRIDIKKFYEGLDIMFQRRDKRETREYMESWLREAEGKNDLRGIIAVSNELGGLYRAIGETNKAKALYATVLQGLTTLGLDKTEHFATALINTGDVYVYTWEYEEALNCFMAARTILIECGLAGDYRMAALCNNISMVYRNTSRYDKAEEALDIAFNIIKGLPQCRDELATTYVNLGELQIKQNKLEMAMQSFQEACRIYEEQGGMNVHYSSAVAGLAMVYYLKGQRTQSIEHYKRALELIDRDFGKTDYYRMVEQNMLRAKGF